jgi:hypothetical protein
VAKISRSPRVDGSARIDDEKSPRVITRRAPAKPPASPASFQAPKRSCSVIAERIADQTGVRPMSHPACVADVRVSA